MTAARFIVADVFDGLATLDDGSVDLVVTSPPFLALRSYLPADHPDKGKEIGSEATPAEFLDTLLAVTAELRRVLAPHGSIAIELGDTYAGSGLGGLTETEVAASEEEERKWRRHSGRNEWEQQHPIAFGNGRSGGGEGWPLPKSKTLVPELYRISLAYGINPLTGQESPAGRWRIRNVVTWCRPNPPVGALGDKWRPATSDIVIACTSDKRYWDDIATRRPIEEVKDQRYRSTNGPKQGADPSEVLTANYKQRVPSSPHGSPLLDWWELPPGGYHGAHYAVYPPALVEPLIKAMAPPKVCRTCGEPSRRIVEKSAEYEELRANQRTNNHPTEWDKAVGNRSTAFDSSTPVTAEYVTVGWTDCGHDDWRPAVVLDPFAGTGTTLAVATGHGHDAIGIDLDERNYDLALERVGPMLLGPPERVEGHLR